MDISISPKLKRFIKKRVEQGDYNSAGELVHDAIQLLTETDEVRRHRLHQLTSELQEGITDLEQGNYSAFTEEFFDEVEDESRRLLDEQRS